MRQLVDRSLVKVGIFKEHVAQVNEVDTHSRFFVRILHHEWVGHPSMEFDLFNNVGVDQFFYFLPYGDGLLTSYLHSFWGDRPDSVIDSQFLKDHILVDTWHVVGLLSKHLYELS